MRKTICIGQIREFVAGAYGNDPVVMAAAELRACLHPSDIDYADILSTFGRDVDRLMRQMEVPRTAGEGANDTAIRVKRIQSASKEGQTILLACLIVDTEQKLVHQGRVLGGRATILDLVEVLPYFKDASSGLIDLAEQIVEMEY